MFDQRISRGLGLDPVYQSLDYGTRATRTRKKSWTDPDRPTTLNIHTRLLIYYIVI